MALAFQLRAIPKSALRSKVRELTEDEISELELATDEAIGRVEPDVAWSEAAVNATRPEATS